MQNTNTQKHVQITAGRYKEITTKYLLQAARLLLMGHGRFTEAQSIRRISRWDGLQKRCQNRQGYSVRYLRCRGCCCKDFKSWDYFLSVAGLV